MKSIESIINVGKIIPARKERITLLSRYVAYAEKQESLKILWYMKVIMAIPCVFMVISIIAMSMLISSYVWFVGLTMVLFFTNVILHIAEVKSVIYVPVFHATIAIMTIIPIITSFIVL